MKKLMYLCLVVLITTSCKKKESVAPASKATATTTTCQTSIWKYEVILTDSVEAGAFDIIYLDEYTNNIYDTTITKVWTKTLGVMFSKTPTLSLIITIGPHYMQHIPPNTNLSNMIKLNIYKDGVIMQTTGVYMKFCQQNIGGSTCPVGSENNLQIYTSCQ